MSRRTQKNVGVIGLGIIGQRVAENLRRDGFHVFVWNRTPRPFPNFVGSPSEIAQLCDFVQIFVSDDEALLEMVQQMKPALNAHHVIMAHSTVAPHTMRAAAEIAQRRGAHFLDAPFTGSKNAAENGELVYYIGGDDVAYRRAQPVLEASSREIIEIGEIGQATTIKIATNMVTAATVQGAAEALALVHNSGLPLEKFAEAMRSNGSNSGTLMMKLPKMIEGDFEPHFSVKHMLKDVEIAARLARAYGLMFGSTEAARDSLVAEMRRNRSNYDYCSLIHAFFPDGPPGRSAEPAEGEEQPSLTGLDEEDAARAEKGPEPGAEERAAEEAVAIEDEVEAQEVSDAAESPSLEARTAPDATATTGADESLAGEPNAPVVDDKAVEGETSPGEAAEATAAEAHDDESEEAPAPDATLVAPAGGAGSPEQKETGTRRGFFSRMFGKGFDY
ncbi:MAG: NAD(P)-dependent oxidoreductase [Chthoniobacterales bacterium]